MIWILLLFAIPFAFAFAALLLAVGVAAFAAVSSFLMMWWEDRRFPLREVESDGGREE